MGWLRAADQTVLALQDRVVTHNARISVSHENYVTWRLRIKQLRETDKACYMCQINSSPMKKQIGCIDVQSEYKFHPHTHITHTYRWLNTFVKYLYTITLIGSSCLSAFHRVELHAIVSILIFLGCDSV